MCETRQGFLRAVSSAVALPLIGSATKRANPAHAFIASAASEGEDASWLSTYPDECYAFTCFANSALTADSGWFLGFPFCAYQAAIVIDFASRSEAEAEAAIRGEWDRSLEVPLGTVSSVSGRRRINEQNTLVTRHLCLIATGDKSRDVITKDACHLKNGCGDRLCSICSSGSKQRLADVLGLVPRTIRKDQLHIFSHWAPSRRLAAALADCGIRLLHHPLASIPRADFEANREYHVWDGTFTQFLEFNNTVWCPAWKKLKAPRGTY